jgi:WhiB family redox-sensing transcriptional regulator
VTVTGSKEYIRPPGFEQFELIAQRVADRGPDTEPDLSWRGVAACRDTSPELFFPIGTTGQAVEQIEAAKAVCMSCPSQVACLEFALSTNQDSGVWGGTSEEDRRHLRRTYISRRR